MFCADGWYGLDPAYDYEGLRLHVSEGNRRAEIHLKEVNHFAKEMDHLCECVEQNREPWTPGEEGLRDTLVMAAVQQSAATGKAVRLQDVGPNGAIVPMG